ncbi:hypothetical protein LIA77_09421 [Sarocladium implicatum]|nr:hypothetical protein LIA77_09421 [Sarocladium implicatum]
MIGLQGTPTKSPGAGHFDGTCSPAPNRDDGTPASPTINSKCESGSRDFIRSDELLFIKPAAARRSSSIPGHQLCVSGAARGDNSRRSSSWDRDSEETSIL